MIGLWRKQMPNDETEDVWEGCAESGVFYAVGCVISVTVEFGPDVFPVIAGFFGWHHCEPSSATPNGSHGCHGLFPAT